MIFLPFIFLGVKAATCVRENGANECWHFTGFNHNLVVNTLGDNCGRYLAASKWIIFPNFFQDQSIESAEARLSIINESFPSLDYEQSELLCALIFPKCQRNICADVERTFLFTQSYNSDRWSCEKTAERSRYIYDPMMPSVYANGEASRKSRFNCSGLPASKSNSFYQKSFMKPRETGVNHKECERRVKTLFHFKDWIYVERYLTCLITLHGSSSMKIYKVGSSTRNLDLIAVKITDPENENGRGAKPKVRLMGNIHGNEDQGIFILLPLIRDILAGQKYENMRKSLEMHFLISANPDGYLHARLTFRSHGKICWTCGRQNRNRVDLNRNFPQLIEEIRHTREKFAQTKEPNFAGKGRQVFMPIPSSYWAIGNVQEETLSIIKWTRSRNFVLSAMIHSGAWVVNYPYDTSLRHPHAETHDNEDVNAFKKISKDFVKLHKTLLRQEPCMHGADEFQEKGITNGAAWYSTIGTLQDYEYIAQGVMAFTLELGCQKTTPMANLPIIYSDARDAMIDFMWHGYMGIRGKVHDERGHVISNAEIFIEETYWNGTVALNPLSVISDENGNFNKIFWSENATAKVSVHVTHDKFQEKTFTLREPILRELKDFRHCRQTNSFLENSCEYKLPRAIKIKLLKQRK